MVRGSCEQKDCTVAETGTCLLYAEPGRCPQFRSSGSALTGDGAALGSGGHSGPFTRPVARRFHAGSELGTLDASELMRGRYCHLIGILGPTNAGKTCFLTSLYFKACHGGLGDYLFAESLTLQGFEDRARLVRRWEHGRLPDQLAEHTRRSDPRSPAFLHLALRRRAEPQRRFDFLLTDLPGEWSNDLIDRAETAERFAFLHRADGIIVVIDGTLLAKAPNRHTEVHRTQLLLSRLSGNVQLDTTVPLVLLVSKGDEIAMKTPGDVEKIRGHATELGFEPEVVVAASFSRKPEKVESGTGVLEALENVIHRKPPPDLRRTLDAAKGARVFSRVEE